MAVRRVSTIFAVEGEAEYKLAIANINRELGTLQAALAGATAEFDSSGGSIDALKNKLAALEAVYDAQTRKTKELADAQVNAARAEAEYGETILKQKKALDDAAKAREEYEKTISGTDDELRRLRDAEEALHKEILDNEKNMKNAAQATQNWERQLNTASAQMTKTAKNINEVKEEIEQLDGKPAFDALAESAKALAGAMAASGLMNAAREVGEAFKECINASIEFESAITGVYKTVYGTDEQLAALTREIKEMSSEIPMAASQLAAIAESAGQLGIATENITEFTDVIAKLTVATNLSAEQGAADLARLANITNMSADYYSNLGSSIVQLGNTSAATESEIVSMAMRIAAAGTQANMSVPDILGISAALSSVGLQAEAGGTAISTAIYKIDEFTREGGAKLAMLGEIAGMTGTAFAKLWSEDSSAALTEFIVGLGEIDGVSQSVAGVLDELGLSGIRTTDAFGRLAGNTDLFVRSIETANSAWSENIALTREAEIRFDTFESKIQLFDNAFERLKIAIGDDFNAALKPAVEGLTEFINSLSEVVEASPGISAAIAGIGTALLAFTGLTGVVSAIGAVVAGIKVLGATVAGVVGPAALAAAAIAGLIAAFSVMTANMPDVNAELKKAAEEAKNFAAAYDEAKASFESAIGEIDFDSREIDLMIQKIEELAKAERSAAQDAMLKTYIDELNSALPGLNMTFEELTTGVEAAGERMRSFADNAVAAAKAAAYAAEMQRTAAAQITAELNLETAQAQKDKLERELETMLKELERRGHENVRENFANALAIENDGFFAIADNLYDPLRNTADMIKIVSEEIESYQSVLDDTGGYLDQLATKQGEYASQAKKTASVIKETAKSTGDGLKEELNSISAFADALKELGDISTDDIISVADDIIASFDRINKNELNLDNIKSLKGDITDVMGVLRDEIKEQEAAINDLGDAIAEALKNQYAAQRDAAKAAASAMLEAEKEASEARLEIYREEHDEKIRLLESATAVILESFDADIAAIQGLISADAEALRQEKWEKKLADYDNKITEARDKVASSSSAMAAVLDEYEGKAADIISEHAGIIAAAEEEKVAAMEEAQGRVDEVTVRYTDSLAEAEAAANAFLERERELYKQLNEARKAGDTGRAGQIGNEIISGEADVAAFEELKHEIISETAGLQRELVNVTHESNEEILKAQFEQTQAEIALAEEKRDALIAAAESAAFANVETQKKYTAEIAKINEKYAREIEAEKKKSTATAEEEAKKQKAISEAEAARTKELFELKMSYQEKFATEEDKNRQKAMDDAVKLADLEIKKAEEVLEVQRKAIEENRNAQIAALEEQSRIVEESAKKLKETYEAQYAAQKEQEDERLAAVQTYYGELNRAADAHYEYLVSGIKEKTLELVGEYGKNFDDIALLLKEYNQPWYDAGGEWATELAKGAATVEDKLAETMGKGVDTATARLDVLYEKLKEILEIMGVLDEYEEKLEDAEKKAGDRPVMPKTAKQLSIWGQDSANYFVDGFVGTINERSDEAETATGVLGVKAKKGLTEELEENSPSKAAIRIANYFVDPFVDTIADGAEGAYDAGVIVGEAVREGLTDGIAGFIGGVSGDVIPGEIDVNVNIEGEALETFEALEENIEEQLTETQIIISRLEAIDENVLRIAEMLADFDARLLNSAAEAQEQIAEIKTAEAMSFSPAVWERSVNMSRDERVNNVSQVVNYHVPVYSMYENARLNRQLIEGVLL